VSARRFANGSGGYSGNVLSGNGIGVGSGGPSANGSGVAILSGYGVAIASSSGVSLNPSFYGLRFFGNASVSGSGSESGLSHGNHHRP